MTKQVLKRCSLLLCFAAWLNMPGLVQASTPMERKGEDSDRVFLPGNFFTPLAESPPAVKRKPSVAGEPPTLEQLKLIESLTADQNKQLSDLYKYYKDDIAALRSELKGITDASAKAAVQTRISLRQHALTEALKQVVKTEQMEELERKKKGLSADLEVENLP